MSVFVGPVKQLLMPVLKKKSCHVNTQLGEFCLVCTERISALHINMRLALLFFFFILNVIYSLSNELHFLQALFLSQFIVLMATVVGILKWACDQKLNSW